MKNTPNSNTNHVQFATVGKKKYVHHFAFAKKDAIIRNIEIIVVGAIVLIAGAGIYGYFN
jgi:hypothetical protein